MSTVDELVEYSPIEEFSWNSIHGQLLPIVLPFNSLDLPRHEVLLLLKSHGSYHLVVLLPLGRGGKDNVLVVRFVELFQVNTLRIFPISRDPLV